MAPGLFSNGTFSVGGVDVDLASVLEAARTPTGKLTVAVVAPSIAILFWFWVAYQTSPLRKYPGPFLAGAVMFHCVSLLAFPPKRYAASFRYLPH